MKRLFLTSSAYCVMDLLLRRLAKSPKESRIAFIGTASHPYAEAPWLEADLQKLRDLEFQISEIDLKDATEAQLRKEFSDKDIIFVAGGNTYYLLYHMRKSGFDVVLDECLQRGVVYIGSSAGSIVVGPSVEYANRFDDPHKAPLLNNFKGLGLVDFVALPHWGNPKYEERYAQVFQELYHSGQNVIPLSDSQAMISEDGMCQFVE